MSDSGFIVGTVTSSKLQTETHLISITPNPNINFGTGEGSIGLKLIP